MEVVIVAVAVAIITSVVGPTTIVVLNNKARRVDRREDWERQDEVARRVENASMHAAEKAEEVRVTLLTTDKETNDKLDVIHTLVNSSMTAAMQSELDALRRELVLMKVLAGGDPNVDAQTSIVTAETRIEDLTRKLDEREKQQQLANAQLQKNTIAVDENTEATERNTARRESGAV